MTLELFDTHAHLDMPHFHDDREAVIARARVAGVSTILTVGTDLASSRQAVQLAERGDGLLAAVGCHPQDAGRMQPGDLARLEALATRPRVIAIGEVGLDYYRDKTPRHIQQQVFRQQLELAGRLRLPVLVHIRQAELEATAILREWITGFQPPLPGVIHCFSGDGRAAAQYLEMGFYLALGAYIGYPSSRLASVIREIPAERLLLETDCPFLPPQTYRGRRNEPAYLTLTLAALAKIRGDSEVVLAQQTTANARWLFAPGASKG